MNIGVKIQRIKTEDYIWLIYIFIAISALISDNFERSFLLTRNYKKQKIFKTINIAILCVAFFIYLYFVLINYEDIKTLKKEAAKPNVITSHIALIASILFLVGGILTLIAEIRRDNPNIDIGIT